MQSRGRYGAEILIDKFCVPVYLGKEVVEGDRMYDVVKFHSYAIHKLTVPDADEMTYKLVNGKR